jgi:hypothetical protein
MLEKYAEKLANALKDRGISEQKITDVIDSGYVLFPVNGMNCVLDQMYGLKGMSSCFELDKFCEYLEEDRNPFSQYDLSHCTYVVKNMDDIQAILSDERRKHYIERGALSFRGQTQEYNFKRKIPSPVRANAKGEEISVFPGVFRQAPSKFYSFSVPWEEKRTIEMYLHELEPNDPEIYIYASHTYDYMRVEQHYGTQTSGLDISFDIETAIFFATYHYNSDKNNVAHHTKIQRGQHQGVIYGFKFTNPPVNKSEFYVNGFDLFKTNTPERLLRQDCGLPLIGAHERNIATTDVDFVMYLHEDFDYEGLKSPEYMFPDESEDKFYAKLMELKKKHPEVLSNIVEYAN